MKEHEYNKIMESNGIFVFDTNVYLELYRLSTRACNDIIELLQRIKDNIRIPCHVYKEYCGKAQEVKGKQYNIYKNARTSMLSNLEKYISSETRLLKEYSRLQYPQIDALEVEYLSLTTELKKKITGYFDEINSEIKDKKEYLDSDIVRKFIDSLCNEGQVWPGFSSQKLIEIIKEGEIRFKYKIPPGYMDSEKQDLNKFGDLFIWKEVLQHASENKDNIIFITNDVKEDWWEDSKQLEARRELKEEFMSINAESNIVFLTLQSFFELTSHYYEVDAYMTTLELQLNERMEELIGKEDKEAIEQYIDKHIDKYYEELKDDDAIEESRYIFTIHKLKNGHFEKRDEHTIFFSMEAQYYAVCRESYEGIKEIGIHAERDFDIYIRIELQYDVDIVSRKINRKSIKIVPFDDYVTYRSPGEVYEDMRQDVLADQMDALEEYCRH